MRRRLRGARLYRILVLVALQCLVGGLCFKLIKTSTSAAETAAIAKQVTRKALYDDADSSKVATTMIHDGTPNMLPSQEEKEDDDDDDEHNLHVCRTNDSDLYEYICAGEAYDKFVDKLWTFAGNKHSSTWGRRSFPLPPNRNVLFFGNSHTRQVCRAIQCQYGAVLENTIQQDESPPELVLTLEFQNNATLTCITNSPLVYTGGTNWAKYIERNILRRKFNSLDAIVLGKFNGYKESMGTRFMAMMLNLTTDTVDFKRTRPPQLIDVAKVYPGPVIYLSMFGKNGQWQLERNQRFMKKILTTNRTNISLMSGRKYIEVLGECGSDKKKVAGICNMRGDNNTGRNPADMHRCFGMGGGHADLIAWDVVEQLANVLY